MRRRTRQEVGEGVSQTLSHIYVKTPRIVKRYAKPIIKTSIRMSKKLVPFRETSTVKAHKWIDTNIMGSKVVRIANKLIPLKKKKK